MSSLTRPIARQQSSAIARSIVYSTGPSLPVPLSSVDAWYFDPAAGTPQTRWHNGKVWAKDHARSGSVRLMQPGRAFAFNGTTDKLEWVTASTGTHYLTYYNLANDTISTVVLTYSTDRYVFAPASAVTCLNLQHWTDNLASTEEKQAYSGTPANLFARHYGDEGSGTAGTNNVAIDSSGNGNDGTITAASLANFHDVSANNVYSRQNEFGYTVGTGSNGAAAGVLIPLVNATTDAKGNAAQYQGQCPHDAVIYGPCATFNGTTDGADAIGRITTGSVTALTCAAWVYVQTQTTGFATVCGEFNFTGDKRQWSLGISNSRQLRGIVSDDGTYAGGKDYLSPAMTTGWHHLAITFGSSTLRLFIDGSEVLSPTKSSDGAVASLFNGTEPFRLGYAPSLRWVGRVGDVRIFSDAKDLATINQIMQGEEIIEGHVETWPCQDKIDATNPGTIAGVNGNDLTITSGSLANVWANGQPVFDSLTSESGTIIETQRLDIYNDEPDSPYAQQLDAVLADGDVTVGDTLPEASTAYGRDDGTELDRVIVDLDADAGQITALTDYTA